MVLSLIIKLLHVLSTFWFIGGLLGRTLAYALARRALDLNNLAAFVLVAVRFERMMVRPGSIVVLIAGLLTAFLQGWPLLGFLAGSPVNWLFASVVLYLSVALLIPTVFLVRGHRLQMALTDALAEGQVTLGLTAALEDRVLAAARAYEWIVVLAVLILMVAKPF